MSQPMQRRTGQRRTGQRRVERGFTMLELMTVVALSSIAITAAVAVFVTLAKQQRIYDRAVDAQTSALVSVASIQRDAANAGYRFPVPALAFRHIDNVSGSTALPTTSGSISTAGGCAPGYGLSPGTDVVEFTQGFPGAEPGSVSSGTIAGSGVTGTASTGTIEPFFLSEVGGTANNSIVAFATGVPGASKLCMARVTASTTAGSSNLSLTLSFIDRDLVTLGATYYDPSCLAAPTRLYRFQQRVRYMVCRPTTAPQPKDSQLFRQETDTYGNWLTPQLLEEGIEDLQVAPLFVDPTGAIAALGGAPTCTNNGVAMCQCFDKTSGDCELTGSNANPNPLTTASLVSQLRGAKVMITAISKRQADEGAQNTLLHPYNSYNHAAAAAGDNYLRVQREVSFSFNNFAILP